MKDTFLTPVTRNDQLTDARTLSLRYAGIPLPACPVTCIQRLHSGRTAITVIQYFSILIVPAMTLTFRDGKCALAEDVCVVRPVCPEYA